MGAVPSSYEIGSSDHQSELVEGGSDGQAGERINSEFVVSSLEVLDEGMARIALHGFPRSAAWMGFRHPQGQPT